MPGPGARINDITATGDTIIGPGVPTVLIGGVPASVVGDVVEGEACVGAVAPANASPTVLIAGRPATRVGTQVLGAHPKSGVPVTTVVAPPGCPTVFVGP